MEWLSVWKLCHGRHLCERCGNFVDQSWLHFIAPLTFDHTICEECAAGILEEDQIRQDRRRL